MKSIYRIALSLPLLYALLCGLLALMQRRLLYFPSHEDAAPIAKGYGLLPWQAGDQVIGYARRVADAQRIWLVLHGNAGQAAHRGYVLPCFGERDDIYILEYPGYGARAGAPSETAMNRAAAEGYEALRHDYPNHPVNVLGESIGSGPACHLAGLKHPPARMVLVVAFARLTDVAREKLAFLPVAWLLRDRWDNIAALSGYAGALDIYGARLDRVIPIHHARDLAAAVPGARFHELPCDHNGWADPRFVNLRQ